MPTDRAPAVNSQSPDYPAHIASLVETAQEIALKPGSSTSEAKVTFIGGFLFPALLAAFDHLPALWASLIAGVVALLYTFLRTRIKGEVVAELHDFADTLAAHAQQRAEFASILPPPVFLHRAIGTDGVTGPIGETGTPGQAGPRAAEMPHIDGNAGFITPGLCVIAAALSALACLLLGGCSALPLPKAKVVYRSHLFDVSYDGKTLKTDLHGELAPGLTVEGR